MNHARRRLHNRRFTLCVLQVVISLVACTEPHAERVGDSDAIGLASEALCTAPDLIRIVSANTAHIDLPSYPPGAGSRLAWLDGQVEFLDSRQLGSQATVYALQETSIQNSLSYELHWPNRIASQLSGGGECRQYDWVQYAPNYWVNGAIPAPDTATDESFGTALISNVGWNYSNRMDLYDSSVGTRCTFPGTGTLDNMRHRAAVARLTEGSTEIWVLSVHLTPREMAVNRCQLNNLLAELDAINPNIKIVVTGDFNIHPTIHPVDYDYMLSEFSSRGFIRAGGQGRDHMFVRDPYGELGWTFTGVFAFTTSSPAQQSEEIGFPLSDHAIMVLDLQLKPWTARTCLNRCGGAGGSGPGSTCWCDSECSAFGDCCWDRDVWCPGGADPVGDTCLLRCGGSGASGSCWCDSACVTQGDCCADYAGYCVGPSCDVAHDGGYTPINFPYVTLPGAFGGTCACDRLSSPAGGGCAGPGRNDCCFDARTTY